MQLDQECDALCSQWTNFDSALPGEFLEDDHEECQSGGK